MGIATQYCEFRAHNARNRALQTAQTLPHRSFSFAFPKCFWYCCQIELQMKTLLPEASHREPPGSCKKTSHNSI